MEKTDSIKECKSNMHFDDEFPTPYTKVPVITRIIQNMYHISIYIGAAICLMGQVDALPWTPNLDEFLEHELGLIPPEENKEHHQHKTHEHDTKTLPNWLRDVMSEHADFTA